MRLKGLNLAWTLRCFFMQDFGENDPNKHYDAITFDFDSTLNRQYGLKMEGVRPGYKEFLCLDTLQVFCDKGFQYWNEFREGGTHTAEGSAEIVHHVLDQVPKEVDGRPLHRFIRADAGYCNYNFMNSCHAKEALHGLYRVKAYERAARAYTRFTDRLGQSNVPEVKRLRRTLISWREEILEYFNTPLTNGRTEGFNGKAKLIRRRAYGYRSFRNYRLRVLKDCA